MKALARRRGHVWYVVCPLCKKKVFLDECPAPGGMGYNVEFCPECGTKIEVIPPRRD